MRHDDSRGQDLKTPAELSNISNDVGGCQETPSPFRPLEPAYLTRNPFDLAEDVFEAARARSAAV
jgi:hypothetical protein